MGQKIACTKRAGLSVLRVERNKLDALYYQLVDLLEESGYDYKNFFARPKDVPSEKSIDWYSDLSGNVESFSALNEEQADKVLRKFNELNVNLKAFSEKLSKSGDRTGSELIKAALAIPDHSYIYLVGEQIVITCWGFVKSEGALVSDDELSGNLRSNLQKESEQELKGNYKQSLVKESETDLKDTIKENYNSPSTLEVVDNTEDEVSESDNGVTKKKRSYNRRAKKTIVSDNENDVDSAVVSQMASGSEKDGRPIHQEIQESSSSKKSNWWVYLLLLLGLLLLILLVYWYFSRGSNNSTLQIPPKTEMKSDDLSFLKGTLRIKDVLENEKGQLVDLKIIFKDGSGIGESVIQTNEQVCKGSVNALLVNNDRVDLNLSDITCPNNNNFQNFNIQCNKARTTCYGKVPGGVTWEVSPSVED